MISTVFQIALLRLWNNKQELLLTLIVPILFFSIFALMFARGVGGDAKAIRVAIVDDDGSPLAKQIIQLLKEQPTLRIDGNPSHTNDQWPIDKLTKRVIRERGADVVIHLPAGTEQALQTRERVSVQVLSEGTNPVGRQIVNSMLTQIVAAALSEFAQPDQLADLTSPFLAISQMSPLPLTRQFGVSPGEPVAGSSAQLIDLSRGSSGLFSIETTDVFATGKHNPKIAMYAAGIAVMFLLLSATGAGGSLLEEYEAGTLDRLLSSRLSISQLLAGKWIYITCLGCVQLTVMFVWAQLVFGVDLLGHVTGFTVMAGCTAAATSSLALCLAVFCRSRTQLNGVSIVLILTMSALGGSMVPRYIMSDQMQRWGQLTFNAWALDGFKKVFWYDLPVSEMHTEISVLLAMAMGLACVARIFADRWAAD